MNVNAEIRRFGAVALGAAEKIIRMTGLEALAVAQIEPPGFEMSRAGYRFGGGIQNGATGRAPVASIPTTAAAWLLWNGEPDGGAAYAMESVTLAQISGTAAVGGVILAALTTAKIAAPTPATGYATGSFSKGTRASRAVWADNQTLSATPTWWALAGNGNPAVSTNGGATIDLGGRLVVPPGFGLALHYLSGAGTTPLLGASAVWAEIPAAMLE